MDDENLLRKKAELLLAESIVLDRNVIVPFPLSRSSAGPEVGSRTLVMEFSGIRVKLRVSRDTSRSEFSLIIPEMTDKNKGKTMIGKDIGGGEQSREWEIGYGQEKWSSEIERGVERRSRGRNRGEQDSGTFTIMKGSKVFLENVKLIHTPIHAPNQAFINIDARCRYHCLFCTSPDLIHYKRISNQRWIDHIRKLTSTGAIEAIAITSGIAGTIEENIRDFISILRGVSDLGLPMGVEPYVDDERHLKELYRAGARELKLNVQSWDREIFEVICPGLDWNTIMRMLEKGVDIFGRNMVTSNIIIGLGETDGNVIEGIETLAKIGVAATVRKLHLNSQNEKKLRNVLELEPISPERLLGLRAAQQDIFQSYGIDSSRFRTMCFACGGCDLDL